LALIFSLAIFFLSDFLAIKVFKNELLINDIKSVSLAVIPTTLLVIISGTYQSLKQTFSHTIFKTGFINIVFTLFLVLNFYVLEKFEEIFIMYAGATYIVFIVGFFTLRKKILSHKLENNKSVEINVKQIVKVSTPMLYSSSFALLIGWVNIILLGYFADESEVGIYDSAGRLAALSSIALIAINSIVAPKFAESFARKNNEELEQVTKKSTKMIFLATTPILVIMVVFGRTALTMFGSEFVVGYWTLVVLCIAKFVGAVSGSVGYLLQMTGRQKVYLNIVAIAFLINLTLGFYLIPKHGYVGAAVATAIAVIFSNLVSIWIIKRRLGFWTFYLPFISK
jgi:O-antigen/teichoic acid export membrane protein